MTQPLVITHGMETASGGYGLTVVSQPQSLVRIWSDGRAAWGADDPVSFGAHVILSAADADGTVLFGTDNGQLLCGRDGGQAETLATFGRKWVEHVAARGGTVAAGVGKTLHLLKADGSSIASADHASSVTGIAFDAKGKRVAVSHYNGASLHWSSGGGKPQLLEWKGSHIGITLSPDAKFVVTAMQDAALHGWKLPEAKNMRMSGYPAKTRSMAWSVKAKWLATSGAPSVICWPFFHKDGPMGKGPVEFSGPGALVTRVACHPQKDFLAAGYEDGLVMLFRMDDAADILVAAPQGSAVTGLAFAGDGSQLGFIRENGSSGVLAMPQ